MSIAPNQNETPTADLTVINMNESQEFVELSSSTDGDYDTEDVPKDFFADLDAPFINFTEVKLCFLCFQRLSLRFGISVLEQTSETCPAAEAETREAPGPCFPNCGAELRG